MTDRAQPKSINELALELSFPGLDPTHPAGELASQLIDEVVQADEAKASSDDYAANLGLTVRRGMAKEKLRTATIFHAAAKRIVGNLLSPSSEDSLPEALSFAHGVAMSDAKKRFPGLPDMVNKVGAVVGSFDAALRS